ncbi:Actin-related protein 8 [Balamuthia mandrillaris]
MRKTRARASRAKEQEEEEMEEEQDDEEQQPIYADRAADGVSNNRSTYGLEEKKEINQKKVVVLHPGSAFLRVGSANDSRPLTMPHVIARRVLSIHSSNQAEKEEDKDKHTEKEDKDGEDERYQQEQRAAEERMKTTLKAIKSEIPSKRQPLHDEVERFDESNCTEVVSEQEDISFTWTDLSERPSVLFGQEALNIADVTHYRLRYPIRRGKLNIRRDYPLQEVRGDLAAIWRYACATVLDMRNQNHTHPQTFSEYSAILLIPDDYDRRDVKELISLLLFDLKFSSILLQQESVCTTFGSGVTTACVVDVGHQKTSISCVEDGYCLPAARVTMPFGGYDISRFLLWLLKTSTKHHFPLPQCDIRKPQHEAIINELKQSCHVQFENQSTQMLSFYERRPGQPSLRHHLNISDALLIAPLSLFHPSVLLFDIMERPPGYEETSYFEDWLRELPGSKGPAPAKDTTSTANADSQPELDEKEEKHSDARVMPLDEAIVHSVCLISQKKDLKKKLLSTIVLTGGSTMFAGLPEMLEERVSQLVTKSDQLADVDLEAAEVLSTYRKEYELDPQFAGWRGGAILASLASSEGLWLNAKEWRDKGELCLKEKAAFYW